MTTLKRRLLTGFLFLCLCLSLCALVPTQASADDEISKVLVTLSREPVVMDGVYSASAATSTEGCTIVSYGWYDSSGNYADGTFGTGNYRVEITVNAVDPYHFADTVEVYLNNSAVSYTSNGSSSLTIYRDYTPALWAPSVTKNPTSENVEVGELASFVAMATYTETYEWTATSPDGKTTCNCNELPDLFPGVSIGGDGKEKMNIRNVPKELDGWKVRCTFKGPGGSANSSWATVNVKVPATPSPSPSLSPSPSPSAKPSPSPSPTASPNPSDDPNHVHTYSGTWSYDDSKHWRECDCGSKTDEAEHDMEWSTVTKATKEAPGTERGVCKVCGYTTERELEYKGMSLIWKIIIALIALAVILAAAWFILNNISNSKRRKRRKNSSSRSGHEHYEGRHGSHEARHSSRDDAEDDYWSGYRRDR